MKFVIEIDCSLLSIDQSRDPHLKLYLVYDIPHQLLHQMYKRNHINFFETLKVILSKLLSKGDKNTKYND